jgi:competence protein ComEC
VTTHPITLLSTVAAGLTLLLAACTPAQTPAQPTVGAAATAVAKPANTAAVAASPAAATVVAAASPVATALASPAATAAAGASPAAGTAVAASPVRITAAQLSPTDSTITLQNTSATAADLAGWRLRVGTASAALPSGTRVGPNETLTIHTASGTNTARDIYLGPESAALLAGLRPGATVALLNAQGASVAEFTLPG